MHLLSVQNLTKHYGEKTLFQNVNLTLSPGQRVGIIGVNGSGKSTLLRLLAEQDSPDSGSIERNPKTRLAYLPQNPPMGKAISVLDYLFQGDSPTLRLLNDYENAVIALNKDPHNPQKQETLSQLSQKMTLLDGWTAEAKAKAILTQLGLSEFEQTLGQLSGGQRRRAALARALLDPADLLLLDEPTNHLDPDTVAWLENALADYPGAVLLVTHDRYFLDRIVDHILEIEHAQLYLHPGNYSAYLQNQAEREARNQKREDERQKLVAKELEWLHRAPMARGGKQKARIQRAEDLLETQYTRQERQLDINVASRRTGKKIIEIHNLQKSLGGTLLIEDFSYSIKRGDRLGLVGPNGSGKSTLLNLISGRLEPDAGQIVVGETIHIGYYDQESLKLDETQRVLDYIAETAEVIRTAQGDTLTAAQMLERFQFSRKTQWNYIGSLSGGERRRLYLLRTLMLAPNVLILDEPTNDLDIKTLTILEDYLDSFDGVLLTVSHDRYFLDRTVEHIFVFEGAGKIEQYPGNYSTYQAQKAAQAQKTSESPPPKTSPSPQAKPDSTPKAEIGPRKLSYQEKKELAGLEDKIMDLETERESLTEAINSAGDDYQKLESLAENLSQLEAQIDTAMERWAELSERAEAT